MLKEVAIQRKADAVCIEFGRMGPMYWVWTENGKNSIPRAVAEQMIREGANVIKIVK